MTFVDFAPHLTSSYYSMLTAPACPHVRIPGKQLRNINVMMNYVPVVQSQRTTPDHPCAGLASRFNLPMLSSSQVSEFHL